MNYYILYYKDGTSEILTEGELATKLAYCETQPDFCNIDYWELYTPPDGDGEPPATNYILTVSIIPAGAGSVLASPIGDYIGPGQRSYPEGTIVTLTALPSISGAYFDHWEGNITGTANPVSITMNSNKTVAAVFEVPVGTYQLTTSVIGNGSIAPSEGIYNPNDQIILVASPDSGNAFVVWSGDIDGTTPVPGMPNNLQVTMDKDRHIIAEFEVLPIEFSNLTVTYSKA